MLISALNHRIVGGGLVLAVESEKGLKMELKILPQQYIH